MKNGEESQAFEITLIRANAHPPRGCVATRASHLGEFDLVVYKGCVLVALSEPEARRGEIRAHSRIILGHPPPLIPTKGVASEIRVL